MNNQEQSANQPFKFNLKSVNILAESKHRTLEFEMLKKFTIDGMISTQRALISMGIGVGLFVAIFSFLIADMGRFPYIVIPTVILTICLTIITLNYMISSRNKSMLSSVMTLLSFSFFERARRSGKRDGDLKSFGIRDVNEKTGLITFEDEDMVGRLYRVEGQLSRSSLPAVANQTAIVKSQYLIARPDTVQETLITSIKNINVREQLKSYARFFDNASSSSPGDAWRRYMSSMMYNYVSEEIDDQETTVVQCLMIRDIDEQALMRSEQEFHNSVNNGLYALVQPLTTKAEIAEYLAPLTILSKGGQRKYGSVS